MVNNESKHVVLPNLAQLKLSCQFKIEYENIFSL